MTELHDIHPLRLIEAAEAACRVARAFQSATGEPAPWPPDLITTGGRPRDLIGFTKEEIEAGSRFLVRIGVFHRPGPRPAPP